MKEYDYIIAGAGIAGTVCGKLLAQKGKSCVILEEQNEPFEKVCGGLIPHRAVLLLKYLGFDVDLLLIEGAVRINGIITEKNDNFIVQSFANSKYAIGTQRVILQKLLIKEANKSGCRVVFSEKVSHIEKTDDKININGFKGRSFISAIGARPLEYQTLVFQIRQTYGISEIISADSNIKKDYVYFYYPDKNHLDYFWFIPIGKDIWNIGYWTNSPNGLKQSFYHYRDKYLLQYFRNVTTLRRPKGAICGSTDYRNTNFENSYGIGDFAGTCSLYSGAGIFSAIKSAKDLVQCLSKLTP